VNELVDTDATPPSRVWDTPMLVEPSLNWTVPTGMPAPGAVAVTVAVNWTFWPTIEALSDEETATDVSAGFTTWLVAPVLRLKLGSPLYVAVTGWVPAVRLLIVDVA
jgi:hypothetical protein